VAAAPQPMQVDLSTSAGIQAGAIISADLWASSQAAIRAQATAKGFYLDVYSVTPGETGYQTLTTIEAVNAWLASVAQYADRGIASSLAGEENGAGGWATVGLVAGIGIVGALAWWLYRAKM
jgi:hypothetical protein